MEKVRNWKEEYQRRKLEPNYKERHSASNKKWRDENKEYRKMYMQNYWFLNQDKLLKKHRSYHKEYLQKLKRIVMEHYSKGKPKCANCGISNIKVLSINHIHGGGRKHRKDINGHFYRWLIKNNFPKNYEVLCFNCNWLKYNN